LETPVQRNGNVLSAFLADVRTGSSWVS
jgi:hypothetical protein